MQINGLNLYKHKEWSGYICCFGSLWQSTYSIFKVWGRVVLNSYWANLNFWPQFEYWLNCCHGLGLKILVRHMNCAYPLRKDLIALCVFKASAISDPFSSTPHRHHIFYTTSFLYSLFKLNILTYWGLDLMIYESTVLVFYLFVRVFSATILSYLLVYL